VVLVIGAAFATSPLRDALTRGPAAGASLDAPRSYVWLTPLCTTLDALSLLTVRQHVAFLVTVLMLAGIWRARRARLVGASVAKQSLAIGATVLGTLIVVLITYAYGALGSRPMVSLMMRDSSVVLVDVHSHTNASHDGRRGFDAARNRAWHAAAGFHVAYVTDHRSFVGAADGLRSNPQRAGDGTVLLSGIEAIVGGEHLNYLGVRPADSVLFRGSGADTAALAERLREPVPPLVVLTIPASLRGPFLRGELSAVEISDAAPRGLEFQIRHRAELRALAESLGVATVAGSDNHGWGRTAAAWTAVRLPGWQRLTPDELDGELRTVILRNGRTNVQVIERVATPYDGGLVRVVATGPLLVWTVSTQLTMGERLSWLVWVWALALARRRYWGQTRVLRRG
jgi:predicted metal-dependent phosphoesterase TrpH